MTPEAMRIAIAESEGWKRGGKNCRQDFCWYPPNSKTITTEDMMPNYTEDLNAILPLLPIGIVIHILLNKFEFSAGDFTLYIQGKSLALAACEFYLKWKGKWLE